MSQPGALASAVPPGATDCHLHVFGPVAHYPFANPRAYTPPEAPPAAAAGMLRSLGLTRAVLVQPSVYGMDDSCLLAAADALDLPVRLVTSAAAARPERLDALHRAGVRGVRINALAARSRRPEDLEHEIAAAAERIQAFGWHVELALTAEVLVALAPFLERCATPVVIGHMGFVAAPGSRSAAARALVDLLARTRHWVKLSGADRTAPTARGWDDVAAVVRDLVASAPDRLVWGSDWPHTAMHAGEPVVDAPLRPFREVDTELLLRALGDWLADDTTHRRVLVDNPARLYGFDAPAR